jgi:hypothetical protein
MIIFFKKYIKYILLGASLILLTISNIYLFNTKKEYKLNEYILNQKIDSLYQEISKNQEKIELNKKNIANYEDYIKQISLELKENNIKYNKLKHQHNESLSKISHYSNNDINEYFNSRYSTN